MKYFSIIILVIASLVNAKGQAPGIVIQSGLTAAYSKDFNITKGNEMHYGWMVGADARLLEGDMYFIIGGQYHRTGLMSTASPDFFKNNDWALFHGRCGVGFNIFRISENIIFRSKILGSINFLLDAPKDALNIPEYKEINDSSLGAVTGLGVTIGSFDIDLDFQYGIINAYKEKPKSTFDIWTLMAGFHF